MIPVAEVTTVTEVKTSWKKWKIWSVITPNSESDQKQQLMLTAFWIGLMLFVWSIGAAKFLPTPMEVVGAFPGLWNNSGLGEAILKSITLCWTSVGIMFVLAYAISIATVTPLGRPLANIVSLGRFNGFVGLPLVFSSLLHDDGMVKIALLVFGMGVFTVLSLIKLFDSVPKDLFDHARTLRMSESRVVWEVVVLGTFDSVMDVLRVNIAMGWMMLPMVEGRFKTMGGIGALMETENKYLNLDVVFCILFIITIVGFLQDWLMSVIKNTACEYSLIGMERK